MRITEHFTWDEIASPGHLELGVQDGFLDRLEALRVAYGHPMVVTSGARTREHNKRVGGAAASMHLIDNPKYQCDCLAVDVHMLDASLRRRFVEIALANRWSVGVGKSFVHVDARADLLQLPQVMWGYG